MEIQVKNKSSYDVQELLLTELKSSRYGDLESH